MPNQPPHPATTGVRGMSNESSALSNAIWANVGRAARPYSRCRVPCEPGRVLADRGTGVRTRRGSPEMICRL